MIFANLKDARRYRGISDNLDIALEHLTPEFLTTVGNEKMEIKGSDVYCFRANLETQPEENTFFENHREYIDIHTVLDGVEGMDIALPETLELYKEKPEDDAYFYHGQSDIHLFLHNDNFLIAFPEDAHRTMKMAGDAPEKFSKVVFKIRL